MVPSKKRWLGSVSWQTMGKLHTMHVGKELAAAWGRAAHHVVVSETRPHGPKYPRAEPAAAEEKQEHKDFFPSSEGESSTAFAKASGSPLWSLNP